MLELLQYRAWALAESYYSRVYPVLAERLRRGQGIEGLIKKQTEEDVMPRLQALLTTPSAAGDLEIKFGRDEQTGIPVATVGDKNIALISVIGPLTKYGGLCTDGMQSYQSRINRAHSSANIHGSVLIMDTPGGTVDGTPEFGLTVRTSAKPVGVFGDGMVASAGLWIASQAATIVGNKNNPTEFGSIGVLMVLPNWQNVMEAGYEPRMEIFRAKQSTEKALINSIEPITDEARAALIEELTDIATAFIATVTFGRGDKLNADTDGIFNGRMYDVKASKKAGLIDEIGTLHTAVKRVADISRQRSKLSLNSNANNMKFPKLSALLGAAWASITGSGSEAKDLTTEQQASLEASEKKLSDMEADNAQLQATIEANNTTIASLNTQISEQQTQITTLQTTATTLQAELDKKPTGQATTVIAGKKEEEQATDPKGAAKDMNRYRTSVDDQADAIRKANSNLAFK